MIRRQLVMLLVVASVALVACGGGTDTAIDSVAAPAAADAIAAGAVVLDIRTPEEFAAGKLDSAVNIDFYAADFAAQLDRLDKDKDYVIYCRSGNRTSQSLETFRELGFSSITEVDGGIVAWDEAGLPIVP